MLNRLKSYLVLVKKFGIFFIPAAYLVAAGTIALVWRNFLPEILSLTIVFSGCLLASVTYRLVLLRESVKNLMEKIDAHVMFVPKGQSSTEIFQTLSENDDDDPSGSIIH